MIKKILLAATLAVSSASAISGEGLNLEQAFKSCGIGGLLFKGQPTLAIISNLTWDSGTTAASSAISSAESCNDNHLAIASYLGTHGEKIESQAALGTGQELETLAAIGGCDSKVLGAAIEKASLALPAEASAQDRVMSTYAASIQSCSI